MYRRLTALAAGVSLLALAACGGDDNSTSEAAGNPTEPPSGSVADSATTSDATTDAVVAVADVEGFGEVLVDSTGMALYFADGEAEDNFICVDACTSFWTPLEPGDGTMPEVPGIEAFDVFERPDGSEQLAADGKPLYTFVQDSEGEITGDGFEDDFGDAHLSWHVVSVAADSIASTSVTADSTAGAAAVPADGSPTTEGGRGDYDYGDY